MINPSTKADEHFTLITHKISDILNFIVLIRFSLKHCVSQLKITHKKSIFETSKKVAIWFTRSFSENEQTISVQWRISVQIGLRIYFHSKGVAKQKRRSWYLQLGTSLVSSYHRTRILSFSMSADPLFSTT